MFRFNHKFLIFVAILTLGSIALLGATCGGDDESANARRNDDDDDNGDDDDRNEGLYIDQRGPTQICEPAGVRVVFSVYEDGNPVPDLEESDFEVINDETGRPFQSEGGSSAFLQARTDFSFDSILVLDLSQSIVDNDRLDDVLDGARVFVKAMVSDQRAEYKHNVAIYVFGSTAESELVQDFTQNAGDLYAAIEDLRSDPGRGSTNLYGAFIEGLNLLTAEGQGDTAIRSLIILTDGTHETGDEESMRRQALDRLDASKAVSYAIGIKGDYNEDRLRELASNSSNFFLVENTQEILDAFGDVADLVEDWTRSNYIMGVCSPLEGPDRSLTIRLEYHDRTAERTIYYDATGFNLTDCDSDRVAAGEGCEDVGDDDDDDDDDDDAPSVESFSPENGAEDLKLRTEIVVTFDRAMDTAATEAAFSIDGASGDIAWSIGDKTLTFTPSGGLFDEGTSYTVTITRDAKSADGVRMAAEFAFGFTTVDLWTALIDGPAHSGDGGYGIAVDDQHSVYVTGSVNSTSYGPEIWVGRFNSAGTLLWSDTVQGSGNNTDQGHGIAVQDDIVYVAGTYTNDSADMWIRRYTAAGVISWTRTWDPGLVFHYSDHGEDVTIDSAGNAYLCGTTFDGAGLNSWDNAIIRKYEPDGDDSTWVEWNFYDGYDEFRGCTRGANDAIYATGVIESSGGDKDNFYTKIYSSGSHAFRRYLNGYSDYDDAGEAIAVDSNDEFVLAGMKYVSGHYLDVHVSKMTADGVDSIWSDTYDGAYGGSDAAMGVAIDGDDNVVVVGYVVDTGNVLRIWLRKYDTDGTILWTQIHESAAGHCTGHDVAVDDLGNIYATGYYTVSGQGANIWVRKYDPDGEWAE